MCSADQRGADLYRKNPCPWSLIGVSSYKGRLQIPSFIDLKSTILIGQNEAALIDVKILIGYSYAVLIRWERISPTG